MYNKFPGKDITEEDIKSKIPLVANFSKEPFEIAGVVFNGKKILRECYKNHLPRWYFKLPKKGFEVPLQKWLRKD